MIGNDRLHREMFILLERLLRVERDIRKVSVELALHADSCATHLGSEEVGSERSGDASVPNQPSPKRSTDGV